MPGMDELLNSVDRYRNFVFLDPGELREGDLSLILQKCSPADPAKGWVPSYTFTIQVDGSTAPAGEVNFRAGSTRDLEMYGGHFGYGVNEDFRGKHLAERACRLLFPFIQRHGM